jgi:dTDP-glucose pyrophosphorylase
MSHYSVSPDASIQECIACIDRNKGIALATDSDGRLVGTVTDGDVRRAILGGQSLEAPVRELLARKVDWPRREPITAPSGTPKDMLVQTMLDNKVRAIPLMDSDHRPVQVVTLDELLPKHLPSLRAVIMAGGRGQRLSPLTDSVPKPMLAVGNRPLLERIVQQLERSGIRKVYLATHYKADFIAAHFQDGKAFGVDIEYLTEDRPLGTAGALGLLQRPTEPVLVMNGDILTGLDVHALLDYHLSHKSEMTVVVREFNVTIPYGVVHNGLDSLTITAVVEKPNFRYFINAGIYVLSPEVWSAIPRAEPCDMPELISRLIAQGRKPISFPTREYWLDIGQIQDYERACLEVGEIDATETGNSRYGQSLPSVGGNGSVPKTNGAVAFRGE